MQPTTPAVSEHAHSVARKTAYGPRRVIRRAFTHSRDTTERHEALTQSAQDLRERVAGAFRRMARSVEAPTAHEETLDFYRSGGQDWTRALDRQSDHDMRARVAGAFRAMAHGAEAEAAQAQALRFYRSSGHAWARELR